LLETMWQGGFLQKDEKSGLRSIWRFSWENPPMGANLWEAKEFTIDNF